jgi:hypothetical protein
MHNPNFIQENEEQRRLRMADLSPGERFLLLMRLIRIDRMLRGAKIIHAKT